MERLGFTRDDLAIFGIEEDGTREEQLRERMAPRLDTIAQRFSAPLSRLVGRSHAPSVILGPPSASVFFLPVEGSPADGPRFAIAVTRGGVHVRVLLERCDGREALARRLSKSAVALSRELGDKDLRCYDDWDGRGIPPPAPSREPAFWREVSARLARAGGLDIGVGWPEARAVLLSFEDLLPACRSLLPLYKRLV